MLSKLVAIGLAATLVLLLAPPSTARVLAEEQPLMPVPDNVWIRGTKVSLVDTKQCWKRGSEPVLLAKVDGKYIKVAEGKLVNTGCDQDYPFEARFRFTLKHGGEAQKLTLKSTDASGEGVTYRRTVYSSMAEYNDYVARLLGVLDEALTGRPGGSGGGPLVGPGSTSSTGWSGCYFRGKYMAGTVKVVDFGLADFTVKRVTALPDLRVKPVDFLATACGEWKFVDFGIADFTVKFVDFGVADFSIQFVTMMPGR